MITYLGASEMTASIFDDFFNCFKNSICLLTAFDSNYVEKTLDKIWNGISFTDDNTDGGMLKLRQVINTNTKKRSTHYKVVNGQKIEVGFGSLIEGIVVDKDRKMRGDRVGFLFLEESGSNPILERSFIKAEELVTVGGNKIGIILAAGTGGDSGPALQGLNKVYYNPDDFLVLPFHHNYTETGDWVTTGFFMPAYITMNKRGYTGERGEYLLEKLKEFYIKRRESFKDPQTLLSYKAEQCFTAEEAFAAEGVNKFNKVKLSDLIIRICIKLEKPQIQRGYMQFTYKDGSRNRNSISGVKFIPKTDGPVYILQPPLWEITYDREPDETQEAFEERKKNEQSDGTLISEKISNLYVAGIDGIDIGQSETSSETRNPSKFCTMIKRRIYGNKEPEYVAYYIDRPNDIREAYKQTIGLLMWYNCLANLEATRMSVLTYARDNHFMLYFMRRPRSCFSDMTKRRSVNLYGTTATTPMIDHQTLLIADYIEDYSHNIWFIDLLDLLMKYTDENKGKFDMVAAMAMAEVGDEELNDILPKKVEVISKEFQDIGYYIDERGYRRFGVIPKVRLVEVKARWDLYDGRNVTSDPRYR